MMTPLDALGEVEAHFSELKDEDIILMCPDLHGWPGPARAFFEIGRRTRFKVAQAGDLADRGPNTPAVVETMLRLKRERPDAIMLQSNHDTELLRLADTVGIPTGGWALDDDFKDMAAVQYALRYRGIPDDHYQFLRSLEPYHLTRNLLLVHGGIPHRFREHDVSEIPVEEMLTSYGTTKFWTGPKVAAGHLLVDEPTESAVAIQTDSGVWLPRPDARLTICLLDDRDDVQNRLRGWIEVRRDSLAARAVWRMPGGDAR